MKVFIRIVEADEGETVGICKLEEDQLDKLDELFKDQDISWERIEEDMPEFDNAEEVLPWLRGA